MENNSQNTNQNMTYEDKMLYAFVGKPEKFFWYKNAFAKYNHNGVQDFAWNWSWYAFFFSFWYLLYRKVYSWSAILILIYVFFGNIGGIYGLLINIILGGTLPYFVYQKYYEKKKEIEEHIKDEEMRIEIMEKIGGTNNWIVTVTIVFCVITLIAIYLAMGGLIVMSNY